MRRLAFAGAVAAALLVLLLALDGLAAEDVVLAPLLFAPPAILFFFALAAGQVLALPERLRPRAHPEPGAARRAGPSRSRRTHYERARASASSSGGCGAPSARCGLMPLRVFTPWFLGLAAVSALLCVVLLGVAAVAVVVVAVS